MRNDTPQTAEEIQQHFQGFSITATSEIEILGSVVMDILRSGLPVTNKTIISRIIHRLELESNVSSLEDYRHVLELVVHQTEDDPVG